MRKLWILFMSVGVLFGDTEQIRNDTAEPMLCNAFYGAEFKEEELYGIKQRIQVKQELRITKILDQGSVFKREGNGLIKCYNSKAKIESYDGRSMRISDENALESHRMNHEMFDISSYANADRAFVENRYGISQKCQPYKGEEYCKKANGLDILYDTNGRVSKLFIYGNAVNNGELPFEPESLNKLYVNDEPLGLWVTKKNSELINKKPTLQTDSVILWENPAPSIERIIMTPQNGYKGGMSYRHNQGVELMEDRLRSIEIIYKIDDKAYKAKHEKSQKIETWGKHLNPLGTMPRNRFKAFYINTKEPNKVIATEEVPKVSINYPWDQFHGIKSEDFGGYWVGDYYYPEETTMEISLEQSWAKSRVIIDGRVVYEGGNSTSFPYTFKKGSNKIEVEYVNNWHTTGFMLTIKPKEKKYNRDDLQFALKSKVSANAKILYAGVYESSQKDQNIILKLAAHKEPVILVLSSYSGVNWIVENPNKVKIEAIVYSAYNPGTEISGNLPSTVPLLAFDGQLGSYSMSEQCDCHGAMFHCEGSNGLDIIRNIEVVIGKTMFGYSGKYSTDAILLPQTVVTKEHLEKLRDDRLKIEQQRAACRKETNPEFDKIFQQ
ncbi:MAG: hypothetical protein PHW18_00940 [Sulfuricurvum sp.]|uniref:hypothetical protein n=1 Tax=Sulfuricurvum sp. TaxID=2025608 RepID=UPI00262CF145|nr:hypothetical protein [Sulfuricurvum sp.]MDD2828119.1 hypothetical protein [Sulfuricurvum sp.]MDD4948007.1 hypothetical protein [Sulfuricurvum sp.]